MDEDRIREDENHIGRGEKQNRQEADLAYFHSFQHASFDACRSCRFSSDPLSP